MRFSLFAAAALAIFGGASAADIVITVGGNTTGNGKTTFQPDSVTANVGDTVFFNFTLGNHTATQSLFASPCVPAHTSNISINGFDSGFRDAGNETAITILSVPILDGDANTTFWFFDYNTCGEGGVGVINPNTSSTQTIDGFQRNAIRLNGTAATSSSHSGSATSTSPSSTSTSSSGAERLVVLSGAIVLPLVLAALSL